jgi:fatty-acyl-CoA synthase
VSGEPDSQPPGALPEDGLLAIFTSGTTGLPKAAVISHRAHCARMRVLQDDLKIDSADAFVAWSPMFHMGGSEHTLSSMMFGAVTVICDGLDTKRIAKTLASCKVGWLLLVPATIEPLLAELEANPIRVVGVKAVGCMADLVSRASIEAVCRALNAPFLNSFGATETGLPPLSGHLLQPGAEDSDLAKQPNAHCELKLVDAEGTVVPVGAVGEAWVRGPTLFSGYWRDGALDRSVFRGVWYPMGDLFYRDQHGGYHFVGRSKYLIKSGGENIYPAEIERILLADARIEDAVVVRKPDPVWGEVPVAFVIRRDETLQTSDVDQLCRITLAGYKRPKEIHFVAADAVQRNASGKIERESLERRMAG